ncbi:MAG: type IV toxin-antitoxin system AbiEi family antitoxin domain-containing protein [Rhodanobacteraceae bacterium]
MDSTPRQISNLLGRRGTARSRELEALGIARRQLSRMVAAGRLVRVGRGLYALPDYRGGEHEALLAVARRAPGVLFCLLTALRLHELTTQAPFEVWIAIGNKDHPPRLDYPPLRTVRLSASSLGAGVSTLRIDGTPVRVTGVAKTVADCFKFRNKVGLDVALEALREARRTRKAGADELWRYARINRVANVMRPYLEAVA